MGAVPAELLAWTGLKDFPLGAEVLAEWHGDPDVHPYLVSVHSDVVGYGEVRQDLVDQEAQLARIIIHPAHRGRYPIDLAGVTPDMVVELDGKLVDVIAEAGTLFLNPRAQAVYPTRKVIDTRGLSRHLRSEPVDTSFQPRAEAVDASFQPRSLGVDATPEIDQRTDQSRSQ